MNKRCEHPGCQKRPNFAPEGETRPLWCAEHKAAGAVDVMNNRCEHAGCQKQPAFALEGETRSRWCTVHKADGAVDIRSKHCEHAGCRKRPAFALEGESRPRWCVVHKAEGAVDVRHNTCKHPGCSKHPNYALEGDKKPRWCVMHKAEGAVDVKKKVCEHEGCETRAQYGYPGHGLSRCGKKEHRLPGMMSQPSKRCAMKGCSRPALYGTSRPTNCSEHQQGDERNLVHERCKACGLPDLLGLETSLCGDCDPATQQRAYLVKQRAVKATLDLGPHKDYSGYDERLEKGACGQERPDFRWDCGTHAVVLEVDENQHAGRPEECECTRMVNISQSLGLPTHFIRYNPDPYRPEGGKKRVQGDSHAKRMDLLARHLTEMRTEGPVERPEDKGRGYCTMTRLYFDGWAPAVLSEAEVILALEG